MSHFRDDHKIEYAYGAIHKFFYTFGMNNAVVFVDKAIEAATRNKVWSHSVPCSLLYFIELFKEMLNAAYTLHYSRDKKEEVIIEAMENGEVDVCNVDSYTSKFNKSFAWDNFPRTLNARQFHNPYRAINKCCKSMSEAEWNYFLKELTEYALDHDSILEALPPFNMFFMRRQMLRLIEACHLIEVRISRAKETKEENKKGIAK